jgi:hypothetical protein
VSKPTSSQQDADGGDTFLTDLLRGNRPSKKNSTTSSVKDQDEVDDDFDEDELKDVVYDYE